VSLHRETEGFAAYDEALEAGLQDRLTRKEEDRIRGMRAVDTHDYELAVQAFHDLAVNYPQDVVALTYPAEPLRMLHRDEEAVSNLRKAIALDPEGAFAPWALSQELMIAGRREEIPIWINFLERHHHPEYAADIRVNDLFLSGHFDEAAEAIKPIAASNLPLWRSYSFQDLASIQAETGNPREAINTLDSSLSEDVARHDTAQYSTKLLERAYLEIKLGRYDACLQDVHTGFELNPTPESILMADAVLGYLTAAAPAKYASKSLEAVSYMPLRLRTAV
jgi:tetratricopeptide (TPR) repeat protein